VFSSLKTPHQSLKHKNPVSKWLQIFLFCEPCNLMAQIVTIAVSVERQFLVRCICPKCGTKFEGDLSFEELIKIGQTQASQVPTLPQQTQVQ
jgi:hypothetical protein